MSSEDISTADLRTAFTLLVKTVERLEDKVDHIVESVGEVKEEQVAQGMIGEQTLRQATQTNGRVNTLETWQRDHDGAHLSVAQEELRARSFSAGLDSRKREERRAAVRVWKAARPYAITAFVALSSGAGARFAAFFVGGGW